MLQQKIEENRQFESMILKNYNHNPTKFLNHINGLDIDFYLLNSDVMKPETFDEIALNLRKVF